MKMNYQIIKAGKEEIGLVWSDAGRKTRVERIYLPSARLEMADQIVRDFSATGIVPRRIPGGLDARIASLFKGKKLDFDLSVLNLSGLTDFAAKVLRQAFCIPHGKVVTYAGLAAKAGRPRAARAVGNVMADNPFPIVIPCHRVIRADGSVGRFGGGADMKKRLLEKEGIIFESHKRVPRQYLHQ